LSALSFRCPRTTLASRATLTIRTTRTSLAAWTSRTTWTRPAGNEFGKLRFRDESITTGIEILKGRRPALTTSRWLRHNTGTCTGSQHCAE
jgi:hypothetical protein